LRRTRTQEWLSPGTHMRESFRQPTLKAPRRELVYRMRRE